MAKLFLGSQLPPAPPSTLQHPMAEPWHRYPCTPGMLSLGLQSLHATSWCGLIYNPKRAHLVTSLSREKQQLLCAIFSLPGLFWASLLLFLELKPQTSPSQREKQHCLRWAHRNVFRAGKEPTGLSWHVPKQEFLADRTPSSLPGAAALMPLDRQGLCWFMMEIMPGLELKAPCPTPSLPASDSH